MPGPFKLTHHAQQQALARGFALDDVLRAASEPTHTCPVRERDHQRRHAREGLAVVVDMVRMTVVTVYADRAAA